MRTKLYHYWLAANATAIDAAVHALVLFCGAAGAHQMVEAVPALNLPQLASLFAVAFLKAIAEFVAEHPLAELISIHNEGGGSPATGSRPAEPTAASADPITH